MQGANEGLASPTGKGNISVINKDKDKNDITTGALKGLAGGLKGALKTEGTGEEKNFPALEQVEEVFRQKVADVELAKTMAFKFFNKQSANRWKGAEKWEFLAYNFIVNYQENHQNKKHGTATNSTGNRANRQQDGISCAFADLEKLG